MLFVALFSGDCGNEKIDIGDGVSAPDDAIGGVGGEGTRRQGRKIGFMPFGMRRRVGSIAAEGRNRQTSANPRRLRRLSEILRITGDNFRRKFGRQTDVLRFVHQ